MFAHTHAHSIVVPDHLLWITGKEIVCKGHPGTIKERDRGEKALSNQQFIKLQQLVAELCLWDCWALRYP